MPPSPAAPLEEQIDRWRSHLRRRQAIHSVDVAGLEDHLREPAAARLGEQGARWRGLLRRGQAIHSVDVAELEDHLREQIAGLTDAGLAPDEALMVAVTRTGSLDALARGV